MTDMTIEQLQAQYDAARNAWHEASAACSAALGLLISARLAAMEADLASRGIVRGVRVFDENDEKKRIGIYFRCRETEWGRVEPYVLKVKKDGTAHATASIHFGSRAVLKVAP